MNLRTIISIGLPLLLGGMGGNKGYQEDPNFTGGGGGSAQTGGFLNFIREGAQAFTDSRAGQPTFAATEIPRQNRSITDLTRGQAAPGGLSSPMQQLFQTAAVMEAARHFRENGSRDLNMQSMMNDLGYVRPTTTQGKKTVVTERPELSEISVG